MPRATNAPATKARRKKVLKKARGYFGNASRLFRYAKHAVDRAEQYAYRDRKQRKRAFRRLWIARINAGARLHGLSYSRMINGLLKANVEVDRKILAQLAVDDAVAFGELATLAKGA